MHDGRGQLDMTHALPAHTTVRHLHAATVANHAFVLHATVLTARAFPILFRAKNALTEKAVLLRAIRAVINRFRLLHFTERPTADVVRPGQTDLHRRVVVNPVVAGGV